MKIKQLFLWCLLLLAPVVTARAQDPVTAAIQAGIVKVIKAIDLQVQRQQNEVIWLQNAQKALENTLSETRLGEIHDWVEKQRVLYQQYYEELYQVKSLVADFQRVRDIARKQALLLEEYRRVWSLVRQDRHFTPAELAYMGQVYGGMLEQGTRAMDLVLLAVQGYATQLSDAERVELIRQAAGELDALYNDLSLFNRQNMLLSLQRAKSQREITSVRQLYGLY